MFIILTAFGVQLKGLYRYRLGDVVKVMGFHNSTPMLKFVRRSNLLLTINIDKNTEKDLQLAVEAAAKLIKGESPIQSFIGVISYFKGNTFLNLWVGQLVCPDHFFVMPPKGIVSLVILSTSWLREYRATPNWDTTSLHFK